MFELLSVEYSCLGLCSWAEGPTLAFPTKIKNREEEFRELRFIGDCQDCSFLISFCPGTPSVLGRFVSELAL